MAQTETKEETGHTQLPWKATEGGFIVAATSDAVCQLFNKWEEDFDNAQANAAFIVRAVNNHDALLAACQKAKGYMDSINARRFHGEFDGESTLLSDCHGLTAAINAALGKE